MKERGMMPWRDQLRRGWRGFRWCLPAIFWPARVPVWARVVVLLCQATCVIGALAGSVWAIAGACVVTFVAGWVSGGSRDNQE
jgi:hypothetical protein